MMDSGTNETEPRLSLASMYGGGLRKWLARNKWVKDNSLLLVLSAIFVVCVGALAFNNKYGATLGDLTYGTVRDVTMSILIADTVGLFYELFARKSAAQEILRVLRQQQKKEAKAFERLSQMIKESQKVRGSGIIDIGMSRKFLHEELSNLPLSTRNVRILALHGTRMLVNKDFQKRIFSGRLESIRVLLLQPDSRYVNMRAEEYPDEYDEKTIKAQVISSISLLQTWKVKKGTNCQVRLYDEPPSFTLVFADDVLYLSAYRRGLGSQEAEVYKFNNQPQSLFYVFDDYFERVWNRAFELPEAEEVRD